MIEEIPCIDGEPGLPGEFLQLTFQLVHLPLELHLLRRNPLESGLRLLDPEPGFRGQVRSIPLIRQGNSSLPESELLFQFPVLIPGPAERRQLSGYEPPGIVQIHSGKVERFQHRVLLFHRSLCNVSNIAFCLDEIQTENPGPALVVPSLRSRPLATDSAGGYPVPVKEPPYQTDDRIAALATPWGESALAVIRTSGEGSVAALSRLFSRPDALRDAPGGSLRHGFLRDPQSGENIDEVVIAVWRSPRSYTGEESAEIFCHGSLPGIGRIFDLLIPAGFRRARGGESTLRAFLHGRMDLPRAEAVREIVSARSAEAHSLALHRLQGDLSERIGGIKQRLLGIMAGVELQLDYSEDEAEEYVVPDDELGTAETELGTLLSSYRAGRIYQEGVRVAIAGRTNAGKSSLFNLFLREDRSIVSEIHGTTRDFIESWIDLEGIPLRLYDTAGLRDAEGGVEREGILRSGRIIGSADLVLYLVDGGTGLDESDRAFLAENDAATVIPVWTKVDAAEMPDRRMPAGFLPLSAVTGEGFDRLSQEMQSRILRDAPRSRVSR